MKILMILALVLPITPLEAAFRYGLGNAAVKRAEKVVNETTDEVFELTKLSFARSPSNTFVVNSGKAAAPIFPFDPFVYKDDEGYHLFVTTIFCAKGGDFFFAWNPADVDDCDILTTIAGIAYAFSNDKGLTWEFHGGPVLRPPSSGWDSSQIETANVVRVGQKLHLFYSAFDSNFVTRYQIGVATLDLGGRSIRDNLMTQAKEFTRRGGPLIPIETTVEAINNNVQEPGVVFRNGRFEIFWIGLSWSLPDQPADGRAGQNITGFALLRSVFDQDFKEIGQSQIVIPGVAVNITEVKFTDDTYFLFSTTLVSNNDFHENEALEYLTSPDGINWSARNPVLSKRPSGNFDDWGLASPTVVVEDDSLILFYTALQVEAGACFPVPATGRFGQVDASNTRCIHPTIGRAVSPFQHKKQFQR